MHRAVTLLVVMVPVNWIGKPFFLCGWGTLGFGVFDALASSVRVPIVGAGVAITASINLFPHSSTNFVDVILRHAVGSVGIECKADGVAMS